MSILPLPGMARHPCPGSVPNPLLGLSCRKPLLQLFEEADIPPSVGRATAVDLPRTGKKLTEVAPTALSTALQQRRQPAPPNKPAAPAVSNPTRDPTRVRRPFGDISNTRPTVTEPRRVSRGKSPCAIDPLPGPEALSHRAPDRCSEVAKPPVRRQSQGVRGDASAMPKRASRIPTVASLPGTSPPEDPAHADAHTMEPHGPPVAPTIVVSFPAIDDDLAAPDGTPEPSPHKATPHTLPAPLSDAAVQADEWVREVAEELEGQQEELRRLRGQVQALQASGLADADDLQAARHAPPPCRSEPRPEDAEEMRFLRLRIDELLADREAQLSPPIEPPQRITTATQSDPTTDWEAECAVLSGRLQALQGALQQAEEGQRAAVEASHAANARCTQLAAVEAAQQAREQATQALRQRAEAETKMAVEAKQHIEAQLQAVIQQLTGQLQEARAQTTASQLEQQRLARHLQLEVGKAQAEGRRQGAEDAEKLFKERQKQEAAALQREAQSREALEQRLQALQRRAATLQDANQRLTTELRAAEGARDTSAAEAEAERRRRDCDVVAKDQRCKALEQQLQEAQEALRAGHAKESATWRTAVEEADRHRAAAETACAKAVEDQASLSQELQAARHRLAELEDQAKFMAQQLSTAQADLTAATASAQRSESDAQRLEAHVAELQLQLEQSTVELAQVNQSMVQKDHLGRTLERQLSDLETQWSKLGEELRRKDHELASQVLSATDAVTTLEETRCVLGDKTERLAHQSRELQISSQRLQSAVEECAAMRRELQALEAEKQLLGQEVQRLRTALGAQREQQEAAAQQHVRDVQQAQDARDEAVRRVQKLEAEAAAKQQELEETKRARAQGHDKDLQLARQAIRSLQDALDKAQETRKAQPAPDPLQFVPRQDADALMLELSRKEEELMKKQLEAVQLKGKVNHLQRELEGTHYAHQTHMLEAQVQQLGQQLQAAKAELKTKEEEAELFTQELEDRSKDQQATFAELARRDSQIQHLKATVADLEALSQEYSRRATNDARCMQEVRTENEALHKTLAELQQQAASAQERLQQESAGWSRKCGEVREELAQKAAEVAQLQQLLTAQEQPQHHFQWQATQTIQASRGDTLVMAEQSYDFCSGLLVKCAASPIPRVPDEYSDLDSTMDLGLPITPVPALRHDPHLTVSPTRVGWSPLQPSDEDVLLANVPAVPFTSPTPIRPPRKRLLTTATSVDSVQCTTAMTFNICCTREGSTHWARLTKVKRHGLERWKRSGQVAQDRLPRMLCHPRMHKDVQQIQHRWVALSQWFDQHRATRQQGVQRRRCLPCLESPGPVPAIQWSEPQPTAAIAHHHHQQPSCVVVSTSPTASDASIDAKLQAEAQAIPADLELVPSLLFPANARGPLESP